MAKVIISDNSLQYWLMLLHMIYIPLPITYSNCGWTAHRLFNYDCHKASDGGFLTAPLYNEETALGSKLELHIYFV